MFYIRLEGLVLQRLLLQLVVAKIKDVIILIHLYEFIVFIALRLSGALHVGDEICEINGIGVHGQTVEALQKMLVMKHSWSLDDIHRFNQKPI